MPLDATAADTVATTIRVALAAQLPGTDPTGINSLKILIEEIYAGIVANAIVTPLGIPPMTVSGTPVVGVGKVT